MTEQNVEPAYVRCEYKLAEDAVRSYYDHVGVFQQCHRRLELTEEKGVF